MRTVVNPKLLLLVIVVLLAPVGLASAHSSTNYESHRFVMLSGGSASSAGYSVTTVIGQPATSVAESISFKVSGGFLFPDGQVADSDYRLWLPLIEK